MAKNPLPKILLEILGVVVVIVAVYFGAGLDQTTSGGHAGMRMDPGTGIEFPLSKVCAYACGHACACGKGCQSSASLAAATNTARFARSAHSQACPPPPPPQSFDIGGGQLLLAGVGTRAKAAVVKIYGAGYYGEWSFRPLNAPRHYCLRL